MSTAQLDPKLIEIANIPKIAHSPELERLDIRDLNTMNDSTLYHHMLKFEEIAEVHIETYPDMPVLLAGHMGWVAKHILHSRLIAELLKAEAIGDTRLYGAITASMFEIETGC